MNQVKFLIERIPQHSKVWLVDEKGNVLGLVPVCALSVTFDGVATFPVLKLEIPAGRFDGGGVLNPAQVEILFREPANEEAQA